MPKTTTQLSEEVLKIDTRIEEIEKFTKPLKGNGEPGILERMRNIEKWVSSVNGWLKAIALLFLAQLVVGIFTIISWFLRIYPALVELEKVSAMR